MLFDKHDMVAFQCRNIKRQIVTEKSLDFNLFIRLQTRHFTQITFLVTIFYYRQGSNVTIG